MFDSFVDVLSLLTQSISMVLNSFLLKLIQLDFNIIRSVGVFDKLRLKNANKFIEQT